MRVYLDACCLSRLTDDQTQPRIRSEAAAVECILQMVRDGEATWVSSAVLSIEVNRNPDPERRFETARYSSQRMTIYYDERSEACSVFTFAWKILYRG